MTEHGSSPSGRTPPATASCPLGILSSRGWRIREAPRAGRRPARAFILAYSVPDVKNFFEPTQNGLRYPPAETLAKSGSALPGVLGGLRAGLVFSPNACGRPCFQSQRTGIGDPNRFSKGLALPVWCGPPDLPSRLGVCPPWRDRGRSGGRTAGANSTFLTRIDVEHAPPEPQGDRLTGPPFPFPRKRRIALLVSQRNYGVHLRGPASRYQARHQCTRRQHEDGGAQN